MTVYEYHRDQLGVQARFIFSGKNADKKSLNLIGERGLQKKIQKGHVHRLRPNGPHTPMLVAWLTLPPNWQRQLIEAFGEPVRRLKQNWFEKHFERDTKALSFFITYELKDGTTLPDEIIEQYTLNASVLNTVDKVYKNKRNFIKALRGTPNNMGTDENGKKITAWDIIVADCIRFKDIHAHTLPTNAAALRRKLREYKKDGYTTLIHGNWRNDSARKVDEHVIALLNALFADVIEKPTATDVARKYDAFLGGYVEVYSNKDGLKYEPSDYPKLSVQTITNYLAKWENKAGTHTMRSGDRQKWMGKFRPYHSFKVPEYAGSIISIDDRQPPFKMPDGNRVWFYNGIDLASEAYVCWVYGREKKDIIIDFYRQLVRNFALWGLNFPAELEAESNLNSSFKETFLKEGNLFQKVRIEANNARGKRIEGYNRQIRYELEKGNEGFQARPHARSEANQLGPKNVPDLPYESIIEISLNAIETWNNQEHPRIKGKTRWEVFMERQHPDLEPIRWRKVLPYLGYRTKTSCEVGIIRLNGGLFLLGKNGRISYSDKLIELMKRVEGRELDIYWIDDNNGQVLKALVYLRDTDFYICEAIKKPTPNKAKIERNDDDDFNLEAMAKYVASVDRFINSQKKSIEKVTVIDNREKTLNNKFQIPQLRKPTHEMPEYDEAEILDNNEPDEYEEQLNALSTQFQRSLKDRF